MSCDAGYRATSYPAEQWAEWGTQTESEYFLPQATAINVAREFLDGVYVAFSVRFSLVLHTCLGPGALGASCWLRSAPYRERSR